MPTANFLQAAERATKKPVVLFAVESINALKPPPITTQQDFQASKASTNMNFITPDPYEKKLSTAFVATDAFLIDGSEPYYDVYYPVIAVNSDAPSGNYTATSATKNARTIATSVRFLPWINAFGPAMNTTTNVTLWGQLNGGSWQNLHSENFPLGTDYPPTIRTYTLSLSKGSWNFRLICDGYEHNTVRFIDHTDTYETLYSASASIHTKTLDVGLVPTVDSRVEIDDIVPTGCMLTYNVRGTNDPDAINLISHASWVDLGPVVDGQHIAPYRYYDFQATFTTDTHHTPVLQEIRVVAGDEQFDYFSTHQNTPIRGARPYLTGNCLTSLTSRIGLMEFCTTGEISAKFVLTQETSDIIATGYLKNKTVICKLGFEELSEIDYESYFSGTWYDYSIDHENMVVNVKTRDVWKMLKTKVPSEDYFLDENGKKIEGKVYRLEGNIIDVILAVWDLIGLSDRYIDRSGALSLKASQYSGSEWYISRDITSSEDADRILMELAVSAGLFLVPLSDGRLTFRHYDTIVAATPDLTLDARKVKFKVIDGGQKDLSTRQAIYYQQLPGKSGDSKENFGKCHLYIDQAAEINWGEKHTKEWFDKWNLNPVAIQRLAQRMSSWFANPRMTVQAVDAPPRFMGKNPGEVIAVNYLRLPAPEVNWPGFCSQKKFLIMSKTVDPATLNLSFDLFEVGPTEYVTGGLPDYPAWGLFPPVQNLTLTERIQAKPGGGVEIYVDIDFDIPQDYHYGSAEVWYKSGDEWQYAAPVSYAAESTHRTYALSVEAGLTYEIAVVTVNASNLRGTIAQSPQRTISVAAASPPGAVYSLAQKVLENNVTLSWSPNQGTFPIAKYEIRKGINFATADVLGTTDTTYYPIIESQGGTFKYWVVAIDTAKTYGTENGIYASVSSPPDYVLVDQRNLNFSAATLTNAMIEDTDIVVPVNLTETFEEHFTNNSWSTPQDQVDAGFPLYIQPGATSGAYEEIIDYGRLITTAKVVITLTRDTIIGTVTVTPQVSVRALDTDPWTEIGNLYELFAQNFQYLRVHFDFATADSGIMRVHQGTVRLDQKEVTVGFTADITDTTGDGTYIYFSDHSYVFAYIKAIVPGTPFLNDPAKDPVRILINYDGVANPAGFKALAFDKDNNRITLTGVTGAPFIIRGIFGAPEQMVYLSSDYVDTDYVTP